MLSLIVPLAVGYLAVRAVASGLSGAAESGRLDVLLSAPRLAAPPRRGRLRRDRGRARRGPRRQPAPDPARQPARRRRPLLRLGARRLRQRLAAGAALRRPRRRRHRLVAAHQRGHRLGRRACWWRCTWSTWSAASTRASTGSASLGLPLLRQGDRERHRPARLRRRHRRGRAPSPRWARCCSTGATSQPRQQQGQA